MPKLCCRQAGRQGSGGRRGVKVKIGSVMTAAIIYTKVHGMESLRFGAASPPQNRFVARSFLAPPPPFTHRISTATYPNPPPPPATRCLAQLHKYNNNNYFTSLPHTASQLPTTTLCKTEDQQQHPCGGGWHLLRLPPPRAATPKRRERKETRVLGCIHPSGRPASRGKAGKVTVISQVRSTALMR